MKTRVDNLNTVLFTLILFLLLKENFAVIKGSLPLLLVRIHTLRIIDGWLPLLFCHRHQTCIMPWPATIGMSNSQFQIIRSNDVWNLFFPKSQHQSIQSNDVWVVPA